MRGASRSFTMEYGVLSVTMDGIRMTLMWFAKNLDLEMRKPLIHPNLTIPKVSKVKLLYQDFY